MTDGMTEDEIVHRDFDPDTTTPNDAIVTAIADLMVAFRMTFPALVTDR